MSEPLTISDKRRLGMFVGFGMECWSLGWADAHGDNYHALGTLAAGVAVIVFALVRWHPSKENV